MATLEKLIDRFGVDVHDYLPRELDVPVIVGLQVQGDVAVIPTRSSAKVGYPIPVEGVPVVRGEAGGASTCRGGELFSEYRSVVESARRGE